MAWYTAWPAKSQTKGHIPSKSEVSFPLRPRSTRERTFVGTSSGFCSLLTSWKTNIDIFQSVITFLKHAVQVQTTYRKIPVTPKMTQERLLETTVMLLTEFVFCV